MTDRVYLLASAVIAVLAASLVWCATLKGPGTTPDSLQYLFAAQDLLGGASVRSLSHHWPPGYPLLLTLPLSWAESPREALRYLHVLIALLNVILFSACVRPLSSAPSVVTSLATVSFGLAPGFLDVSIMAWSEPPFLAWLMIGFLALREFLKNESRIALLIAAAAMGCALLTRYAGIAFVVVAGVWIFAVMHGQGILRALRDSTMFCSVAILPALIWLIFPGDVAVGGAPRIPGFHPIDYPRLLAGISQSGEWFQSHAFGHAGAAGIALAFMAAIGFTVNSKQTPAVERRFLFLLCTSIAGYLAFMVFSISFFDFYTPLDLRTLWPALILFCIGAGIGAARLAQRSGALTGVIAILFLAPQIAGLSVISDNLSRHMREGVGYFSIDPRRMPIIGASRALPEVTLYSNAPELLRLTTGLKGKLIPSFHDMVRNIPVEDYPAQMEALVGEVRHGQAAVVFFAGFSWRNYLPNGTVFRGLGVGTLAYEGPDGWILGPDMRIPTASPRSEP